MVIDYDGTRPVQTKYIGCSMPNELYQLVRKFAKKRNMSLSFVVRRCIEIVFEEQGEGDAERSED